MLTRGRIYANAGAKVRCSGGVDLVKCGSGCKVVGAWGRLWECDGALRWRTGTLTCRRKYVDADTYIC